MEKDVTLKTYLSFSLGKEQFALNVEYVLSILEMQKITVIPNAPDYLKGMINLRGEVLPVIDSRLKFGMPETNITNNTSIIVLDIKANNKTLKVGALVDSVNEVMDYETSEIQPIPTIGTKYNAEYLNGMVQLNEGFVMILNANKVFVLDDSIILQQEQTKTENL